MSEAAADVGDPYAAMTGGQALCAFDFMPAWNISGLLGMLLKSVKMSLRGWPLRTTCSKRFFQKTGSPTSRTYARPWNAGGHCAIRRIVVSSATPAEHAMGSEQSQYAVQSISSHALPWPDKQPIVAPHRGHLPTARSATTARGSQ